MTKDIFRIETKTVRVTTEVTTKISGFGLRLLNARKAAGMSLVEVGKRFGSSHSRIANWEKGLATPSLKCFLILCRLYGVTPDELLGFKL